MFQEIIVKEQNGPLYNEDSVCCATAFGMMYYLHAKRGMIVWMANSLLLSKRSVTSLPPCGTAKKKVKQMHFMSHS